MIQFFQIWGSHIAVLTVVDSPNGFWKANMPKIPTKVTICEVSPYLMGFKDFQAGISQRLHKLRNFIFLGVWIQIILRWFLWSDWCNHLWFWKNHDNKISGQFMMNSSLHILTLKLWYWLTSIQIMYMLLAKSKNNNHLVFISTHTIVGLVPCSGSLFRLISILCISPKILCFVRPATNEIYWPPICLY